MTDPIDTDKERDILADPYYNHGVRAYLYLDDLDEKEVQIELLRSALKIGVSFAQSWIEENGGIDGCDMSDRLCYEKMVDVLGEEK